MKKSIVLLSGGLDSTVNLYQARQEFDVLRVLHFNYGQMAARKEVEASQYFCDQLGLQLEIVDISWMGQISTSALHAKKKLPQDEVNIFSIEASNQSAKAVWVPNRNGLFLNMAAVYAEALGAEMVIPGFNKEEAETFPDNSKDYLAAVTKAFEYSTQNRVEVFCYTIDENKTEIIKRATELNVPLKELWPCYKDQESWCRKCESCKRFLNACKENNIEI